MVRSFIISTLLLHMYIGQRLDSPLFKDLEAGSAYNYVLHRPTACTHICWISLGNRHVYMKLCTGGFYQPIQSYMCKQGSYMSFA